jgi:hypothetical protein
VLLLLLLLQVMNYFHVAEHMRGIWMANLSNYLLSFTYAKVRAHHVHVPAVSWLPAVLYRVLLQCSQLGT